MIYRPFRGPTARRQQQLQTPACWLLQLPGKPGAGFAPPAVQAGKHLDVDEVPGRRHSDRARPGPHPLIKLVEAVVVHLGVALEVEQPVALPMDLAPPSVIT